MRKLNELTEELIDMQPDQENFPQKQNLFVPELIDVITPVRTKSTKYEDAESFYRRTSSDVYDQRMDNAINTPNSNSDSTLS